MHGIRNELLHTQTKAIGLPLKLIELPDQPDMYTYNNLMYKALNDLKKKGLQATLSNLGVTE